MPKIDKIFSLEITPERFLEACSLNELQEVHLLLGSITDRKLRESQLNQKLSNAIKEGEEAGMEFRMRQFGLYPKDEQ